MWIWCISMWLQSVHQGHEVMWAVEWFLCPLHCDIWLSSSAEMGLIEAIQCENQGQERERNIRTHIIEKKPLSAHSMLQSENHWHMREKKKKWEWECAREIFCCSKPLSTVEKCDWLHIHSAGALPQWSTSVCSLNSAELIRIYLTSVGRHLHSLQNGTNNSRAQAAVHTAGIFKRGKKRCRYSTQGMVR